MDIKSIPIIRVEIDQLKHSIISHMGVYGSVLGEVIDAEIEKAIVNYDFEGEVRLIVNDAISSELKSYFAYGIGRTVIREAVTASLDKIFNKEVLVNE